MTSSIICSLKMVTPVTRPSDLSFEDQVTVSTFSLLLLLSHARRCMMGLISHRSSQGKVKKITYRYLIRAL